MFLDEAEIVVRSGNGGPGKVSFLREKFMPEGGPDGGDGGRGGDVVLEASQHYNTLGIFNRRKRWKAAEGASGAGGNCSGKSGDHLVIPVPCGTLVKLSETGEILADLTDHKQRVVVAAGGRGGRGNSRFKTSTNQTPRTATPGEQGTELRLKLELKLIAEVGIIGFPNAGKSTLISRLTKANPKVAPYPFTTLNPGLGVIERSDRTMVLADIPGLIEGAAEGKGLGHQFLRHVERCEILLHLVDGSEGDARALSRKIAVIDAELAKFSPILATKPQVVVLNKADARPGLAKIAETLSRQRGAEVLVISAVSGVGVTALGDRLMTLVPAKDSPE